MSEDPPFIKHTEVSNFSRGAISIKGLPLNRTARLPSIRSPRDLTLGAQPKRVFTPNIPVRREKKPVSNTEKSLSQNVQKIEKKGPSVNDRRKPRSRNIIQTEGSLFGDGLAANQSKTDKQREPVPKFISPRCAIKKEKMDMSDLKSDLNEILRDDFIDDDEDDDNENEDVKPIIFPYQDSAEKEIKKPPVKKDTFGNKEFAKEMGYDVHKIARFIKKEKGLEETIIPDTDTEEDSQNEMLPFFKKGDSKLLLLQFPNKFSFQLPENQQIESIGVRNSAVEQPNAKNKDKPILSSLPDGCIGKLQVLKSGQVRLVVGSNPYYINSANRFPFKYEAVSIRTGEDKNMMVLGSVEKKLIVVPAAHNILKPLN